MSKQKLKEIENIYLREYKVISMGVDLQKFGKEKNYIPDYFKQNGKKVVLYVGRLIEIKGIKYLIEAIEGLDVKLIIVYSET